jgi:hypothetical protein
MSIRFLNRFRLPFAAALIGLLLGACATGEVWNNSAPETAPSPRSTTKNRTAPALYSRTAQIALWKEAPAGLETGKIPALSISLDLLDTEALAGGTGETAQVLERLFRDTFYRGLTAQDYTQEQIRVQTMEYQDMGEEARHNLGLINSASLNWDYQESYETPVNGARTLVISRNRFFYSGGAHPNYDKTYFVFDREVGLQIGLPDVVRKDAMPALKELINRELRLQKKIGPGDSLKKARFLVDEAEPTENYFFSPQGLGFLWNPYEVAPYVEGYVEITLPYAEIWDLLGPEGRHLAREFGGT